MGDHNKTGSGDSRPTPRARGAMAIITNGRGEVLMHLRDNMPGVAWPGYWAILGGGCEPGEHPDAAIVRELAEEAGLTASDLTRWCEAMDGWGPGRLLTIYHGHYDGPAENLPLTEGVALRFIPPHRLAALRVPPFLRAVLTSYLTA